MSPFFIDNSSVELYNQVMKYPNITFSFVIPAFNEEKNIGNCIQSIRNSGITIRYEIIVVDNGSTDWTSRVARDNGAIVVSEPEKGLVKARIAGAKTAKYDFIAFIDADAIIPHGWIENVLLAFYKNPAVIAVSGPLLFYDTPIYVNKFSKIFYKVAKILHLWWPTMQGGNYVIKSEFLQRSDCLNTGIEFWGEDTATAVKLSKYGKIALTPGAWVWTSGRRLMTDGLFHTTGLYIINYLWVNWFGKPLTKKYKDIRP